MGITTGLVRAANWEKLGYVLSGHVVQWDKNRGKKHTSDGFQTDYYQECKQSTHVKMEKITD